MKPVLHMYSSQLSEIMIFSTGAVVSWYGWLSVYGVYASSNWIIYLSIQLKNLFASCRSREQVLWWQFILKRHLHWVLSKPWLSNLNKSSIIMLVKMQEGHLLGIRRNKLPILARSPYKHDIHWRKVFQIYILGEQYARDQEKYMLLSFAFKLIVAEILFVSQKSCTSSIFLNHLNLFHRHRSFKHLCILFGQQLGHHCDSKSTETESCWTMSHVDTMTFPGVFVGVSSFKSKFMGKSTAQPIFTKGPSNLQRDMWQWQKMTSGSSYQKWEIFLRKQTWQWKPTFSNFQ